MSCAPPKPNSCEFDWGQSIGLSASVNPGGGSGSITGTVSFFEDAAFLGTVAVSATGQASLCVQNETMPYKYVSVEGPVEVIATDVDGENAILFRLVGGVRTEIASAPAPGTHRRSAGSYSWAGFFNTFFWVDPQKKLAAVLLMQTTDEIPHLRTEHAFHRPLFEAYDVDKAIDYATRAGARAASSRPSPGTRRWRRRPFRRAVQPGSGQ